MFPFVGLVLTGGGGAIAVRISDWAADTGSFGCPSYKSWDRPMSVLRPFSFLETSKIAGWNQPIGASITSSKALKVYFRVSWPEARRWKSNSWTEMLDSLIVQTFFFNSSARRKSYRRLKLISSYGKWS